MEDPLQYRFTLGTVRVLTKEGVYFRNARGGFLLPGSVAIELFRRIGPSLEEGFDLATAARHLIPETTRRLADILAALERKGVVAAVPASLSTRPRWIVPEPSVPLCFVVAPDTISTQLEDVLGACGFDVVRRVATDLACLQLSGRPTTIVVVVEDLATATAHMLARIAAQACGRIVIGLACGDLLASLTIEAADTVDTRVLFRKLQGVPILSERAKIRRVRGDSVIREGHIWLSYILAAAVAASPGDSSIGNTEMILIDPVRRTTQRLRLERDPLYSGAHARRPADVAVEALLSVADAERCKHEPPDAFADIVASAPLMVEPFLGPLLQLGEANFLQLPLCRSQAVFKMSDDNSMEDGHWIATGPTYTEARTEALKHGVAAYAAREAVRMRHSLAGQIEGDKNNEAVWVVRLPELIVEPLEPMSSASSDEVLTCATSYLGLLVAGFLEATTAEIASVVRHSVWNLNGGWRE